MTRLTVLYNLPEGSDERTYLRWRLGEHQANNAAMTGVMYTDFAKIDASWPREQPSPYAYMTIADFESREIFEQSFYSEEAQIKLKEDVKRIKDPLFLVSEVLKWSENRGKK